MSKREVLHLLNNERDAHLAFLQRLVRTPAANPPGDTRKAIELVREYLSHKGIQSNIIAPIESAPNLVSVAEGQSAAHTASHRLVLNGHIDHFPVSDAEQWKHDPYSGLVEDGYIHGRGVVDMKAGTAASIIAFTYVHRLRAHLAGQCVLEVVSDEETGGRYGTEYLLEQDESRSTWKGDCVLNAEPGGLESIRFGEKGTLRITFTVQTPGGHGAYLHQDEGSIRVAARVIERLVGLEMLRGEGMDPELHRYLQRDDVRKVADKVMSKGAADSMLKPSVNIGTIKGGVKVNMIPSSCIFEADIRLPIGLEAETVLAKIEELLQDVPEASYVVDEAASNPAAFSPIQHELATLVQQNAHEVRGETTLPICSLGATDCKHFRYKGVPAYTYGPSPETQAEKDERVNVQDFLDTVKVHTLVAWDYLGGPA